MGKKNKKTANKGIIIKTPEQIANITTSGQYLSELLALLYTSIKPGVALIELEEIAQNYMNKNKISGAFKGFNDYPANLCLSVNDCLVHGTPDSYILKNGDLLKVDCGVTYKGGISDAAFSIVVGGDFADPEAGELIHITKEALDLGIKTIKPGKSAYDFAFAIDTHVSSAGFSVIESLTGHGVGTQVHEKPHIYNYPHESTSLITRTPGMVVALEPITAVTSFDYRESTKINPYNGRNLYTKNGDKGAQWEYTVAITDNGYKVLAGLQDIPA